MKPDFLLCVGCVGLLLAFLSGYPAATADPTIPLADPVTLRLPELGMEIRRQKFFDEGTGQAFRINQVVLPGGATREVTEDEVQAYMDADLQQYRARAGAIDRSFYEKMVQAAQVDPEGLYPIVVIAKQDDRPPLPPVLTVDEARRLSDAERDRLIADRDAAVASLLAGSVGLAEEAVLAAGGMEVSAGERLPIVTARMHPADVLSLATHTDALANLYEGGQQAVAPLNNSGCVTRAFAVENLGVHAWDIDVAVLENGEAEAVPCLDMTINPASTGASLAFRKHATNVAGVVGSKDNVYRGMAPGANILSSDIDDAGGLEAAIAWALDEGADIFNFSIAYEPYNSAQAQSQDEALDELVHDYRRSVAVAAGNTANLASDGSLVPGCDMTHTVSTPAKGYNVLAVANWEKVNPTDCSASNDQIHATSCYADPISPNGDREEPDLAAPGNPTSSTDIGANGNACQINFNGGGTSLSAPHVAGALALLIARDGALAQRPEAARAILMATAVHNLGGSGVVSEKEGAGGIDAAAADQVARVGNYVAGEFDSGDLDADDRLTLGQFDFTSSTQRFRVVLAWSNNTAYTGIGLSSGYALADDLDLFLINTATNNVVQGGWSASHDNSYEIFDLIQPPAGTYKLVLQAHPMTDFGLADGASVYYGAAWHVENQCDSSDSDLDGVCDNVDNCVHDYNPDQANSDTDDFGDVCDNCDFVNNNSQADLDEDEVGDACDPDIDGDGCDNDVDDDPYDGLQDIGTWQGVLCNPSSGVLTGPAGANSDLADEELNMTEKLLNCEDPDDDNDGICDGVQALPPGTPGAEDGCEAGPDPCPITDGTNPVLCLKIVACAENPAWFLGCLLSDCVEFFLKIDSLINPNPILVERFQIANQTLYLSPSAGETLADLKQKVSGGNQGQQAVSLAGPTTQDPPRVERRHGVVGSSQQTATLAAPAREDRLRMELWRRGAGTEPDRFVALVAEYAPADVVGEVGAGRYLAVTPPDAEGGTEVQVGASWLVGAPPETAWLDADGDAFPDTYDNCVLAADPDQRDTDRDRIGNQCDADYDNDGVVSTPDLVIFRKALFTTDNENADHDGNGVVSTPDLILFRQQLFNPDAPGPSGFVIPTR